MNTREQPSEIMSHTPKQLSQYSVSHYHRIN